MIYVSWLHDRPVPDPAYQEAVARAYPRGPMPPRTFYMDPQPEGYPVETGAFRVIRQRTINLAEGFQPPVRIPIMRWRGAFRGNSYPGWGLRRVRAMNGVGRPPCKP